MPMLVLVLLVVMVLGHSEQPILQVASREAAGLRSRPCQCESMEDIVSPVHTVASNSAIRLLSIEDIVSVGESVLIWCLMNWL